MTCTTWVRMSGLALLLSVSGAVSAMDHSFISNYEGSKTCLTCHKGKDAEVMQSTHYAWRTENTKIGYPGGGAHGMIDRFCALVGSNGMVNFYGDFGGHKVSTACGKCHVGKYLPFPDPATGQPTQAQIDGLDCLICHAEKYDMNGDGVYEEFESAGKRTLETDANGMRYWHQDHTLTAARSVGEPISAHACYRCHEHGQADPEYKRGTPFEPEYDVHAAAGMKCTDCHAVEGHKIARGSRVSDMHAWERPDVEVDCTNCHNQPHDNATYNMHTQFIACETCHIPYTSGAAIRVWAPILGVESGPLAEIPKYDSETGTYEPYSEYTDAYNQRPAYRWFNGDSSMLAEPVNDAGAWDFMPATKDTPNAKIYPFRPIQSGMIADRRGIPQMPDFDANFTMKSAMEAMADPMKAAGFMRPEGLNDQEKAMLSQFPNMFAFDKEHYLKTGNIAESVSIGLAKQAAMMSGQDPMMMSEADLIAMGSQMWSGEVAGLNLPNNANDPLYAGESDPTKITGSFISLSHAIKKDGALTCLNCHSSNSVLNFTALHYSSERAAQLKSMFQSEAKAWPVYQ
ncbi:MAG: hypothetical protein GC154_21865 [bacterium]|nr:hypothetical protein [bacterium]